MFHGRCGAIGWQRRSQGLPCGHVRSVSRLSFLHIHDPIQIRRRRRRKKDCNKALCHVNGALNLPIARFNWNSNCAWASCCMFHGRCGAIVDGGEDLKAFLVEMFVCFLHVHTSPNSNSHRSMEVSTGANSIECCSRGTTFLQGLESSWRSSERQQKWGIGFQSQWDDQSSEWDIQEK